MLAARRGLEPGKRRRLHSRNSLDDYQKPPGLRGDFCSIVCCGDPIRARQITWVKRLMNSRTTITCTSAGLGLLAAAALAGCTTNSTGTPATTAAQPPAHWQVAQQCWMETEHTAARNLPPDKRAAVVDNCVKAKMNSANSPANGPKS